MSDVSSERISVSREALRAELAEMELRMRIWMSTELDQKASAADVAALRAEVAAQAAMTSATKPLRDQQVRDLQKVIEWREKAQAGHFTEAQAAGMQKVAAAVLAEREGEGWSRRERGFAVVAIGTTVVVSSLNILQTMGAF